jgi:hypothetical protein
MRLAFVVAAILLAVATPAAAQERDTKSGNHFIEHCRKINSDAPGTYGQGLCMGQILGFMYVAPGLPAAYSACWPTGATHGQAVRVVVAFFWTPIRAACTRAFSN